jgi:hypothetical protein
MTDTERLLNLDYKEVRRTDINLLAIECYFRRNGDKKTARQIHDTREHLLGFMGRIKEEKAEEEQRASSDEIE